MSTTNGHERKNYISLLVMCTCFLFLLNIYTYISLNGIVFYSGVLLMLSKYDYERAGGRGHTRIYSAKYFSNFGLLFFSFLCHFSALASIEHGYEE